MRSRTRRGTSDRRSRRAGRNAEFITSLNGWIMTNNFGSFRSGIIDEKRCWVVSCELNLLTMKEERLTQW